MNKLQLISAVKKLGLTPDDYVVVGSGILAALEIRQADDVDLVVSVEVFDRLEQSGEWAKKVFPNDTSYYLVQDIYEVGLDWDSDNSEPNLAELKNNESVIDGIPFVGLDRLYTWKVKRARPKDIIDIRLMDDYLSR